MLARLRSVGSCKKVWALGERSLCITGFLKKNFPGIISRFKESTVVLCHLSVPRSSPFGTKIILGKISSPVQLTATTLR